MSARPPLDAGLTDERRGTTPDAQGLRDRGTGGRLVAQQGVPQPAPSPKKEPAGTLIVYNGVDREVAELYASKLGAAIIVEAASVGAFEDILAKYLRIDHLAVIGHAYRLGPTFAEVPMNRAPRDPPESIATITFEGCKVGDDRKRLEDFRKGYHAGRIQGWTKFNALIWMDLVKGKSINTKGHGTIPFADAVKIYTPYIFPRDRAAFQGFLADPAQTKAAFLFQWLVDELDQRWPHELKVPERAKFLPANELYRILVTANSAQ
jgi:hypothetical protein